MRELDAYSSSPEPASCSYPPLHHLAAFSTSWQAPVEPLRGHPWLSDTAPDSGGTSPSRSHIKDRTPHFKETDSWHQRNTFKNSLHQEVVLSNKSLSNENHGNFMQQKDVNPQPLQLTTKRNVSFCRTPLQSSMVSSHTLNLSCAFQEHDTDHRGFAFLH